MSLILSKIVDLLSKLFTGGHEKRRNAKDAFLVFISRLRGALPKRDVGVFYEKSFKDLRDEVFKLKPFLGRSKSEKLERVWDEYCTISEYDLRPENEASWMSDFHKRFGGEFQSPREIVRFYLDEFYKIAE